MKPEKIIERIQSYNKIHHDEHLDMAVEIIKKQIPMKPVKNQVGDWDYCPTCGCKVTLTGNFCSGYGKNVIGCGQKLDWDLEN